MISYNEAMYQYFILGFKVGMFEKEYIKRGVELGWITNNQADSLLMQFFPEYYQPASSSTTGSSPSSAVKSSSVSASQVSSAPQSASSAVSSASQGTLNSGSALNSTSSDSTNKSESKGD